MKPIKKRTMFCLLLWSSPNLLCTDRLISVAEILAAGEVLDEIVYILHGLERLFGISLSLVVLLDIGCLYHSF